MAHQLKMELIILRETAFFETNDIPQDSQVLIDGFKKRVKTQNEVYENETNKAFHDLQEIVRENFDLEEKIGQAREKLENLENTTGSYGLYYEALTK
jgi:BMFP domain-containing protein YqiC